MDNQKPRDNFTVPELKHYIRINKLKIKLGQKRVELISDLKSIGEWNDIPLLPKVVYMEWRKSVEKTALTKNKINAISDYILLINEENKVIQ